MLHVPTANHKDNFRLSMLLFGNPNTEINTISSYQVDEDGIWIEYFNFDSPGQRNGFR